MKMWLIDDSVRKQIEAAIESGFSPTAEQTEKFEARVFGGNDGGGVRILKNSDSKAVISVNGVLTSAPDIMAYIFGGGNTTYGEIVTAINTAEGDSTVSEIEMRLNTPGGEFSDNFFDVIAAMQAAKKHITTIGENMAASAGYGILSQGDTVLAKGQATQIGSVGVAVSFRVREDIVTITSDDAPEKRPNLKTPEGLAMVKKTLNPMHELLADAIATGRKTTVEKVNAEFGRGATLLAGDALERGMIDAIQEPSLRLVKKPQQTTAQSGNKQEFKSMDINTLKAEHPALFSAAVDIGEEKGIAKERDRVSAHLTMGEASGDMETAKAAIDDGSEMTAALQAKYMAANMNRKDIQGRQDDSDGADGGDGADDAPEASELADQVLAGVEKKLGVEA